jgi:hypothetical protein
MSGQVVRGGSVATAARYEPRPVYVKFAVDEEEIGQVFLKIFRFLHLKLLLHFSIFIFVVTATLSRKKTGKILGSFQLEKSIKVL